MQDATASTSAAFNDLSPNQLAVIEARTQSIGRELFAFGAYERPSGTGTRHSRT